MIFADYTFPSRVASIASAKEIEFVYLRYFFLVHLIKKGTAQDMNGTVMV